MPLIPFGTNTTFSMLEANNVSVYEFGLENAWDAVAHLLNDYNAQLREESQALMARTTTRIKTYGTTADNFQLQEIDEFGTPNVQLTLPGAFAGFPLRQFAAAIGWTRTWAQRHSTQDLAGQVESLILADKKHIQKSLHRALFGGVNYTWVDRLTDQKYDPAPIPVRALLNADGMPIPPGPHGITFDATTHTHYMASSGLTNTWALNFLENLREHYDAGGSVIWIARQDAGAWEALTNFKGLVYSSTIRSANLEYGVGDLDANNQYDRLIGYFDGAEVWVKPWMVAGYCFAYQTEQPVPLMMRVPGTGTDGSGPEVPNAGELTLLYEDEEHPLYARAWDHTYGIAVWNRTNGVCGYFGGAGTAYVAPVFS